MTIARQPTEFASPSKIRPRACSPNRQEIADLIAKRLVQQKEDLQTEFRQPRSVASFYIDDLMPEEVARAIHDAFPHCESMVFKNSLRERKYVAAQMNLYAPLLEEAIFAFQDRRVLDLVGEITGYEQLEPDADLYAGGLSAMSKGNYLKPHLDNSHDKDRTRFRVLNLLYYVSPDWRKEFGGNLELWDDGPKGAPRVLFSKFNRLAVMGTNRKSWHSVSEVVHEGTRRCVSNYYFSPISPDESKYFHATSFRGRPEEWVRDTLLRADAAVRTTLLKTLGSRVFNNPHVYKRNPEAATESANDAQPKG